MQFALLYWKFITLNFNLFCIVVDEFITTQKGQPYIYLYIRTVLKKQIKTQYKRSVLSNLRDSSHIYYLMPHWFSPQLLCILESNWSITLSDWTCEHSWSWLLERAHKPCIPLPLHICAFFIGVHACLWSFITCLTWIKLPVVCFAQYRELHCVD